MKLASSFLYDLVHQLSKSEKRYLTIQHGNSEKDYLKLMNALLEQKHFDEQLLIQEHQKENFIKNLPVNKRYLYEIILRALSRFGEQSLENKIFEKIAAAQILINKGLFKAAYAELKKGLALTKKQELYELQIILLRLEKKLNSLQQNKNKSKQENSESIYLKEKNCLSQLENTNEYWYLNHQLSLFQMQFQKIQTPEQEEYIGTIINSPKFKNQDLASNFKSKIFYFQANSTYQFMLGNVEKAYQNNQEFLDFLESKPSFLKLYGERYLATLNNILIDSFIMGKKEVLEAGINRLEMLPRRKEFKNIKNIEARVFRQKYLLLLNWSISQQEYKKVLQWISKIELGLEQFHENIEKHHRITFYYLTAYLLFINKEFDSALKWNDKILNDSKEDVVKEIFYFARILHLLIHFELENYTLLDSLLLSTPKYLKVRRAIYTSEKELFRFLRKIRNSINAKEKEIHYRNFIEEVEVLFENPKEKRLFNYLDLRLWLNNSAKK